jgi:DNA invertase Pin-like site-specific DNA recombinase
MNRPSPAPVAYSYVRFSSYEQRKGNSLRRQTQKTAEWCERNGITLDTSLSLRDLGVSAFKGRHRTDDKHALAQFLKLVNQGRVPAGSYLVIENLDRLTREDERKALRLWMDILDAGINIVQLKPETIFRHEKSDMMDVMRAIIELSRGHSESVIKSERVGDAWEEKKKDARANGTPLTRRLPAWCELRDGKVVLVPERATVVRRIYTLAIAGYGTALIVKRLIAEKVPPFGDREEYQDDEGQTRFRAVAGRPYGSGRWTRAFVAQVLTDRRAAGEFQPRKLDRSPDGPPLAGYLPRVVSEEEWQQARGAAALKRKAPGRRGHHINLFAHVLKNALTGSTYHAVLHTDGHKGRARPSAPVRTLQCLDGSEGRGRVATFAYEPFEQAVLGLLREIDVREVLGDDDGPDEVRGLAAELAAVESRLGKLEAELAGGEGEEVAPLVRALRQLEARRKDAAARLVEAERRAASPLSSAWGEALGLIEALDAAHDPEEARMSLRGVLRRVIADMRVVVVGRGRTRLAGLQIFYARPQNGVTCRSYLIASTRPHNNGRVRSEGGWRAASLPSDLMPKQGDLDLRDPEHVRDLEAALQAIDLRLLTEALADNPAGSDLQAAWRGVSIRGSQP